MFQEDQENTTRIQEERGRGTEIRSPSDQAKLLQYWAWAEQPIEVGVLVPDEKYTLEFWMKLTLQPLPGDEDMALYPQQLKELWLEKLRTTSQTIAVNLETVGNDFRMRFRYLYNRLRVWFVPRVSFEGGINRSLAEDPIAKDKWVSNDMMVFSWPTMSDADVKENPKILFGPTAKLQERYDDPEVQGGKIALIVVKNNKVQKPPNFLDRMQSTFLKQTAYNQRVLDAEKEVAGINCDVADFLSGMTLDPSDQVVICVNGSEEMKRNEEE
jgi:hypothetical protein